MIKMFFRTITFILFIVFVTIGLSFWKGGEPFRAMGSAINHVGRSVSEFGDFVDDIIAGGQTIGKNYDKLKDIVTDK